MKINDNAHSKGGPRIPPLSGDKIDDETAELLSRVGPFADRNIFTTMVRHPRLYKRWVPYGTAMLYSKLPARDRELPYCARPIAARASTNGPSTCARRPTWRSRDRRSNGFNPIQRRPDGPRRIALSFERLTSSSTSAGSLTRHGRHSRTVTHRV